MSKLVAGMRAKVVSCGSYASYAKGCRCLECMFAAKDHSIATRVRRGGETSRSLAANAAYRNGRRCDDGCMVDTWDMEYLRSLPCVVCAIEPANGVDHIVPFARGGHNVLENLQPMCHADNAAKGTKLMSEYVGWESDYGDF